MCFPYVLLLTMSNEEFVLMSHLQGYMEHMLAMMDEPIVKAFKEAFAKHNINHRLESLYNKRVDNCMYTKKGTMWKNMNRSMFPARALFDVMKSTNDAILEPCFDLLFHKLTFLVFLVIKKSLYWQLCYSCATTCEEKCFFILEPNICAQNKIFFDWYWKMKWNCCLI